MVEMDLVYEGNLRCQATHLPSGATIATDAPKDNQGQGAAFSPTDLVATAWGACALTLMGIYARRHNLALEGTRARVLKDMTTSAPRRIGKLTLVVTIPTPVPAEHRQALEAAAQACPVNKSLHPDVQTTMQFVYG